MTNPPAPADRTKNLINDFTLTTKRWGTILGGLWVIAAVWAIHVSIAVFGVDPIDKLKGRPQKINPYDARASLIVAITTTGITVLVAGRRLRRLRRLSL